jgi:hypothetical protein
MGDRGLCKEKLLSEFDELHEEIKTKLTMGMTAVGII